MQITFPYEIGTEVYYVQLHGLAKKYYLAEGKIFGYSVYGKPTKLDIRVNFKGYNGVSIDSVSIDKSVIQAKVDQLNNYLSDEFGF